MGNPKERVVRKKFSPVAEPLTVDQAEAYAEKLRTNPDHVGGDDNRGGGGDSQTIVYNPAYEEI